MNASLTGSDGYTVKNAFGCRVVFGSVPLSDFAMLNHGYSKKALMDLDLADRMGATAVIGEPEQIEALRKSNPSLSPLRKSYLDNAKSLDLPPAVIEWLANGEQGLSSKAICRVFFGVPADGGIEHPYDPSDLRRCVAFLDSTQTHHRIHEMETVSPSWKGLVDNWTEIVKVLREEIASNSEHAPRTYYLIKRALGER